MDWITLTIELVGIGILIVWSVLPIQEFTEIFRRLRQQNKIGDAADTDRT